MGRKIVVLGVILLVMVLVLLAGVWNLEKRREEMARLKGPEVTLSKAAPAGDTLQEPDASGASMAGKPAPNFTLEDLNGKKVSLADFKGHPVIVNFWATWCGPCRLEMPWFEAVYQQYKGQGLVILGLSQDNGTKASVIADAARQIGVTYPILQPDDTTPKLYGGVDYLPETFYVDARGRIVEETAGAPTKDEIEADVKKMIAAGTK